MAGIVRQPINQEALEKYISDHVPVIKTPIEVKQFGFGQSNPTYQLTDALGKRYVMRKKPPGKLLSRTAHQVEREYRVIRALGPTAVAVPLTYALCEDDSVIGTAFYIMEHLDGRIFEDPLMPGVGAAERTALWREAMRTLGRLHTVDYAAAGLSGFGKEGGYYGRQLKTWSTIQATQARVVDVDSGEAVGPLPHVDEMLRFLADESLRPTDRIALVHGDYKIDNVIFHKTEPRVIGVLDWEMSTIGHPLSDVNNCLMPFHMPPLTAGSQAEAGVPAAFRPGQTPGLPQPAQLLRWYAEVAGYDPRPDMVWGTAFALFRGAVVIQGIAARQAARQASSANARLYAAKRNALGQLAWEVAQKASLKTASKL